MMSRQIKLITFHGSVNYGAVLQSYALFEKISNLGYECEVIDYNRVQHHKNFLHIELNLGIKSVVYQLLNYPRKFRLHRKFDKFTSSYMNLSKDSFNGTGALFGGAFDCDDIYLVGSDQVWNTRLTEENYHYFLDFVESDYKYSYASSFGINDIDDWPDKATVIELLKKFNRISVREETGRNIIRKHLGIDVDVVCDPTFLLRCEDWSQIAHSPNRSGKYVLLFLLSKNDDLVNLAKKLSDQLSIQVINIAYSVRNISYAKNYNCVSPEEFLGLIQNAEYVLTNSFHGFALSLNFNKQVFVALSNIGRNSRIVDLAERYGVSDRIIDDSFDINSIIPIDYDKVNNNIEKDRQKSIRFLEENLHAATD